jgi:hypothetical protein
MILCRQILYALVPSRDKYTMHLLRPYVSCIKSGFYYLLNSKTESFFLVGIMSNRRKKSGLTVAPKYIDVQNLWKNKNWALEYEGKYAFLNSLTTDEFKKLAKKDSNTHKTISFESELVLAKLRTKSLPKGSEQTPTQKSEISYTKTLEKLISDDPTSNEKMDFFTLYRFYIPDILPKTKFERIDRILDLVHPSNKIKDDALQYLNLITTSLAVRLNSRMKEFLEHLEQSRDPKRPLVDQTIDFLTVLKEITPESYFSDMKKETIQAIRDYKRSNRGFMSETGVKFLVLRPIDTCKVLGISHNGLELSGGIQREYIYVLTYIIESMLTTLLNAAGNLTRQTGRSIIVVGDRPKTEITISDVIVSILQHEELSSVFREELIEKERIIYKKELDKLLEVSESLENIVVDYL